MTPDNVKSTVTRGLRKQMELEEARKILGVEPNTAWPEVTEVRLGTLCAV
jgi:hypothetical protein